MAHAGAETDLILHQARNQRTMLAVRPWRPADSPTAHKQGGCGSHAARLPASRRQWRRLNRVALLAVVARGCRVEWKIDVDTHGLSLVIERRAGNLEEHRALVEAPRH